MRERTESKTTAADDRTALALRASEARHRALVESIDEGFCVIEVLFDAEGRPVDYRFLEANPAFLTQTGLADAVGRRMRELAPAHEPHWFEVYGRVATTGTAARFEAPAAALGRWYDVYAFRVDEPHEHHVGVLFTDISTRKRADAERERLLAESEASRARVTAVLESIGDAFYALDADFRFTYVNRRAEALWGRGRDDLIGRSI